MNTVQITILTYYELYYCSDKLTGYDNCCQTHSAVACTQIAVLPMAIYAYNVWAFVWYGYAFNHFVTFLVNTYEGLRNAYTCFGSGFA